MDVNRIRKLEEFLKTEPENALFQFCLGVEYLKSGDPAKAISPLQAAVRAKATYSAAYRELGKAQSGAGMPSEAAETFRQGIRVALEGGDLQTAREMRVFLKRITGEPLTPEEQCCE